MSEKEYVSWCPKDHGSCQHRSSNENYFALDCRKTEKRLGEIMVRGEGSRTEEHKEVGLLIGPCPKRIILH